LIYNDPSGNVVETVLDVASIGWSAYDLWKNPSLKNLGFLIWDAGAALLPFIPGSYTAKGAEILMKADVFAKAPTGVWSKSPVQRGKDIEDALGGMRDVMGDNFKTIDKFVAGNGNVAKSITSIKSIDVTSPTYNKGNNFYNLIRGYADKVAAYTTYSRNGLTVATDSSTKRYLEIALPQVELSKIQAEQLQKAITYSSGKGVEIVIKIVN
jgi:hypothetical protein